MGAGRSYADRGRAMKDRSLPQGERGSALLLEHCDVIHRSAEPRAPAFLRLEEELGNELARLLVGALAARQNNRLRAAA
jgi:hypothetical protein